MSKSKIVRLGGLDDLVDRLTDVLNSPLNKTINYTKIQQALAVGEEIDSNVIAKLLESVHNDLKSNLKYTANALNIICLLLARYELQVSTETLNLCAFEVVNIIAKISSYNNNNALLFLCWETLVALPNETILCLSTSHSQAVMGIIDSNSNTEKYLEDKKVKVNNLVFNFLRKILVILPSDEKEEFVKEDLALWFGKVMPLIIILLPKFPANIDVLELLAEALIPIQYDEDPYWRVILENIYTPKKYPEIMKVLIQNDNNIWCRLWIVLIKLLKNQITKVSNSTGSPINSMLPVVELAFKKDSKYRIQAFQCWNVLIDNFSSELNEAYVNKRIKLLIIPLRSSNAKTEDTALAKFDTWWHLITKYYSKMNNFTEMILIPFLHFCFGSSIPNPKSTGVPPGQFSDTIQRRCLQALLEICGHNECECVITIPKLDGKLITTNLLVQYWDDWFYSLNTVIGTVTNDQSGSTKQHLKCLWKSIALNIAELPDNAIRKDLFDTFLSIISSLSQDATTNEKKKEIAVFVLTCTLFEEQKIWPLLKQKGTAQGPTYNILSRLANTLIYSSFNCDQTELQEKLIEIAKVIIDVPLMSPNDVIEEFFKALPGEGSAWMLWTAFSEAISKSKFEITVTSFLIMVMWPLNTFTPLTDNQSKLAWKSWITMYDSLKRNFKFLIDLEIFKWVKKQQELKTCFQLSVILAFLKNKLVKNNLTKCKDEIMVLGQLLKSCDKGFEEALPLLIDTVISLLSKVEDGILTNGIQLAFIALHTIKMIDQAHKNDTSDKDLKDLMFIDILLKGIENLIKRVPIIINNILDNLLSLLCAENKDNSFNNKIMSLLKNILPSVKDLDGGIAIKITSAISCTEGNEMVNNNSKVDSEPPKDFTSPKSVPSKSSKKEPSIVRSVLVNGEKYEVVNAHWKFNPKKLTEHQKERFKRKREDIPALYQDLSQSQDEFKMITWKTDSQDTSNTTTSSQSNSKSGADDVSNILKNIPSTDVVPKIIENIFSDNVTKDSNNHSVEITANKTLDGSKPKITKTALATKDPKSPRVALKDRVFRNVKNLIEKSAIKQGDSQKPEKVNTTVNEDVLKTPSSEKPVASSSVTNSAPSKISSERPSRVIKKPKKFDDVQLISMKKRRRSVNLNEHSQHDSETVAEITHQNDNKELSESKKHDTVPHVEMSISPQNRTEQDDLTLQNTEVKNAIASDCNEDDNENQKEDKNNAMTDDVVASDACTITKSSKIDIVVNDETLKPPATHNKDSKAKNNDLKTDKNEKKETGSDISKMPETKDEGKNIEVSTPRKENKKPTETSTKKKKSRIEKQLLIDTVEGHPFLQVQSEKRVSRRIHKFLENSTRRKSLTEKLNIAKPDQPSPGKNDKKRNSKDKSPPNKKSDTIVVDDSQDHSQVVEDLPQSEDVIESSQDSTMTTMSVTSSKHFSKIPVVKLDDKISKYIKNKLSSGSQDLLNESPKDLLALSDSGPTHITSPDKDDSAFPKNKTMEEQKSLIHDLTEEMDTQPIEEEDNSELMIISDNKDTPIIINTNDTPCTETQEIAEADTLSMDVDIETTNDKFENTLSQTNANEANSVENEIIISNTPDETYQSLEHDLDQPESVEDGTCSPLKSDEQKKKNFLNDTIEISPIKTMSPIKENKSMSPETSSDFVVIKLATPVQSDGEPFEKSDSPEIFTEDKTSPDKRDQSPPRTTPTNVNHSSPNSSLSLKKNRPQMRSSGRAAQMLGLCAIMNTDESNVGDVDEPKRSNTVSTPVRRNLRVLYSSVGDNNESQPDTSNANESEDSENFLKFKRALPTADSSPAVPILKRKLIEIADEATVSPASKRKRVSFHDPPVSTTVAVTKYIEPGCIRSPQNSAIKRKERQLRATTTIKSAKKLNNVFKLDTVLTKTVESFNTEPSITSIDDVELSSMDTTPVVEVVKTSDLNDTDAIYPDLVNCEDPIMNIASELSSPAMKDLFIKEIEGKLKTISDLAKMTELEVNRLCIKAPKVKVVKKVLSDYSKKVPLMNCQKESEKDLSPPVEIIEKMPEIEKIDMEIQTIGVELKDSDMQTDLKPVSFISTQTELNVTDNSAQTNESGVKSTKKIIQECIAERPDFIAELKKHLPESSVKQVATVLSPDATMDLLMQRISSNTENVSKSTPTSESSLLFLQEYMLKRFDTNLLLFCSQILHKIHYKKN